MILVDSTAVPFVGTGGDHHPFSANDTARQLLIPLDFWCGEPMGSKEYIIPQAWGWALPGIPRYPVDPVTLPDPTGGPHCSRPGDVRCYGWVATGPPGWNTLPAGAARDKPQLMLLTRCHPRLCAFLFPNTPVPLEHPLIACGASGCLPPPLPDASQSGIQTLYTGRFGCHGLITWAGCATRCDYLAPCCRCVGSPDPASLDYTASYGGYFPR